MPKSLLIVGVLIFLVFVGLVLFKDQIPVKEVVTKPENQGGPGLTSPHPLSIESLRKGEFPGSEILIEQTLDPGSNYNRYIASYKSDGLKIYALLTIPFGDPSTGSGLEKPEGGWPVIIFNHGFIPPREYRTTERYVAYTDAFSRNGYVLFKPDYRGHGNSEGQVAGGYGSNAYTIDVLNALASIKKLRDPSIDSGRFVVDPNRIGMWGHSMGGYITLRNMVVNKDIKAGVIWAGVVASYPDLINTWRRRSPLPSTNLPGAIRGWRQSLIEQFGTPEKNPTFWNSISSNAYLKDISGPLQLHHGSADVSVPVEFSQKLEQQMKSVGKEVELFIYPGDDHNLAANLGVALNRSVDFFDKYLK
ncbi:alpha/beta fold hydrolase [Candidatus Daviesbacteria bacterium]|nr:alpha/beta fold hydrolase [Candidatus Daviesbacteria bacterium]